MEDQIDSIRLMGRVSGARGADAGQRESTADEAGKKNEKVKRKRIVGSTAISREEQSRFRRRKKN